MSESTTPTPFREPFGQLLKWSATHLGLAYRNQDAILASLVDGSLASVDPETGRTHWVFDSGSPLLSSSGFAEDSKGGQYTIFPGSDGALYSYRQGGQGEQGLQVLYKH